MAYADSFRIKNSIAAINILNANILDVSNVDQNTKVTIHERVCSSLPPYYIDWFEISYPNVTLNQDDGPFCLQYMNEIQGTQPYVKKCNRLLDAMSTIIE